MQAEISFGKDIIKLKINDSNMLDVISNDEKIKLAGDYVACATSLIDFEVES